eukprot:1157238-Pelagomonas_calceolata.AAC.4
MLHLLVHCLHVNAQSTLRLNLSTSFRTKQTRSSGQPSACCPNSTSFPQLDGPSLPESQCLLKPGVVSELTEQLGETLVNSLVALEELNRISAVRACVESAGGSPNIVLEHFYVGNIMRTLSEGGGSTQESCRTNLTRGTSMQEQMVIPETELVSARSHCKNFEDLMGN